MTVTTDLISRLSDPATSRNNRRDLADSFTRQFGWQQSHILEMPTALPATNLIIEHGIDNAAVLSFLPTNTKTEEVRADDQRNTLALSYNSLIDWHLWIDNESVHYFFNRVDPPSSTYVGRYSPLDYSPLYRSVFDAEAKRPPSPNIPALDDLFLNTISTWRDILALELGPLLTAEAISALMNAIILTRAIEDHHGKMETSTTTPELRQLTSSGNLALGEAIEQSVSTRIGQHGLGTLNLDTLRVFDSLTLSTRSKLVDAFYTNRAIPYDYDFSIISQYALSNIYERYVAILQHDDSVQLSMFPRPGRLSLNKLMGSIYTPPYIATFFARYLSAQYGPHRFVTAKVADPACGSGVFLRSTMEEKLRVSAETESYVAPDQVLDSLEGYDIDENAAAAGRLSLTLLYLMATGTLPEQVRISTQDSLDTEAPFTGEYDAVMANPPFLRTENQRSPLREAIVHHVGFAVKGKLDAYLAFLALSIRALRPGGFGFFVVPHPLLTSDNLRKMRDWIRRETWIRVVVDLSAVRVFEAQVYVVLLVVQKKVSAAIAEPNVDMARCEGEVPQALQDVVQRRRHRTTSYVVFQQPQEALDGLTWSVRGPEEAQLIRSLETLPTVEDFSLVRQGVISGANPAFVIESADVPRGEESLYRPFLRDRMVRRFAMPSEATQYVFYPYHDGRIPSSSELETDFPATWERLLEHQGELSSRRGRDQHTDWWLPTRMRNPEEVLTPKIVAPRLFLLPRFTVDLTGTWVPSHSAFLRSRDGKGDEDLLLFMAALLNSSVSAWYIDQNARKFAHGFNELTVSLLRRVPIPDPRLVAGPDIRRVVEIARALVSGAIDLDREVEAKLDDLLLDVVYRMSDAEVHLVRPLR